MQTSTGSRSLGPIRERLYRHLHLHAASTLYKPSIYSNTLHFLERLHYKFVQPKFTINSCLFRSQHSVRMTAANPMTSARGNHSDMRLCFRMMVWLTAYYEFYDKKVCSIAVCSMAVCHVMVPMAVPQIKSETLCYVVDGQLLPYLKEEGYIRLIQCFLNPGMMLQVEESPNPLRDDEQVIELTREGGHRPVQRQGVKVDPLYQLFVPQDPDKEGQLPAIVLFTNGDSKPFLFQTNPMLTFATPWRTWWA